VEIFNVERDNVGLNTMKDDFFKGIDFNRLSPKQGRLLISEPFLFDSFFKRAVVLLTEHNDEGSVGFILNKPIDVHIHEIVEDFPEFEGDVHFGGPVAEDNLFYLHRLGERLKESKEVLPGLYWGGNFDQLKSLINTKQITRSDIRFFVGYAGWGPEQLKDELDQNSWIVADTSMPQVMRNKTENFWGEKLKGMGKKFAAIANFPDDPTLN